MIGRSNLVGASISVPLKNPLSQDAESTSNVTLSQDAESNVTLSQDAESNVTLSQDAESNVTLSQDAESNVTLSQQRHLEPGCRVCF